MIEFTGHGILLDIEGTTSSVSFVYDVMFPFVRRELKDYLAKQWGDPALTQAVETIAADAGHPSFDAWMKETGGEIDAQVLVRQEVSRLMDNDVKATGLKTLQGLVWKSGFASGELQAHVYDDVPAALAAWQTAGLDIRIYSSGSIAAQKLFFGHTVAGNLLDHFRGHYDTTTGGKKEAASYQAIAAAYQVEPSALLFLSDVVAELDAAREAGFQTGLALRPGNTPATPGHGHAEIRQFDQVQIVPAAN